MEIKNTITDEIVAEGLSHGETAQWILDYAEECSNIDIFHCIFGSKGDSPLDLEEAIYSFDFNRPLLLPVNQQGEQFLIQLDWSDM